MASGVNSEMRDFCAGVKASLRMTGRLHQGVVVEEGGASPDFVDPKPEHVDLGSSMEEAREGVDGNQACSK